MREVPPPGSDIRFSFAYEDLQKNLRLEPIAVSGGYDPSKIIVYLNGVQAREGDYILSRDLEGNMTVGVTEKALDASDPYGIRKHNGLSVKVTATDPGYRRPTTPGVKRKAQGNQKPSPFMQ